MANDVFLKAAPRKNQLSISDAEKIALAYVAKYRGLTDPDSITLLESKMVYYNEVPMMFITYSVFDKNKQILDPEEAMILFGDKSYLIPCLQKQ